MTRGFRLFWARYAGARKKTASDRIVDRTFPPVKLRKLRIRRAGFQPAFLTLLVRVLAFSGCFSCEFHILAHFRRLQIYARVKVADGGLSHERDAGANPNPGSQRPFNDF